MSHVGCRSPLPENISSSITVLAFGRGCRVATVTRRGRGTGKAGHLQLLDVTAWQQVARVGAGGILAAPASVARQTKVKRGRGPKNKKKKEERKFLNITQEDLRALQKILSNKKDSLSATYKENSEANTRVYDVNQKMMATFGNVAVIYN